MARIRSIKPEFFDDPDIGQLSAETALFFIGILTQADKAGRLCDDPRRLKVRIRPYSDCNPEAILTELSEAGFIIRYTGSDGRALIQVRSFLKHQRPHPKEAESELDAPTLQDCSVKTQSREKVVLGREKDMASKVVSGSRKESLEVGMDGSSEAADATSEPPLLTFPTVGYGPKTWHLTASRVAQWRDAYPGLDVMAECRKALAWCDANHTRRKTASGMPAFLVTWLNKSTNSGGPKLAAPANDARERNRLAFERVAARMVNQ